VKPKHVSARLNTLLIKRANDEMGTTDLNGLMNIMQGFRQRKSKDMYMKLRQTLL
jgi:hypothetical protein